MTEVVEVPATCPGKHMSHSGEVHIHQFELGWLLHLEFGCDKCAVKVFSQVLQRAPAIVRDTTGRELRIVVV